MTLPYDRLNNVPGVQLMPDGSTYARRDLGVRPGRYRFLDLVSEIFTFKVALSDARSTYGRSYQFENPDDAISAFLDWSPDVVDLAVCPFSGGGWSRHMPGPGRLNEYPGNGKPEWTSEG